MSALRSLPACVLALGLALGSLAAQQLAEFERLALPTARERTACIAAADVDGDGDVDLIAAPEGAYPGVALRLLTNRGDGRFDGPPNALPPDRLAVRAIVAFDADGDRDVDLFIACQDFQQNRLWLNDGAGHFTDATAAGLPIAQDDSRAAVAADVDGDGDQDLIVVNASGASPVLFNTGQGVFVAGNALPQSGADFIVDVVVADVDGDQDPDLLLANALGPERLLLDDGLGHFTDVTATHLPADTTSTTAIAAIDFEGDGDVDFVVVNYGVPDHLLINVGTGVFTLNAQALPGSDERGSDVTVGDFDGDGDDDLCVGDRDGPDILWRNDGAGMFTRIVGAGWPTVLDETSVVLAFDADGDGDLDIVTGGGRSASAPGRRRLLLNDGQGAFIDATETLWPSRDSETLAVAAADLDGDGAMDVLDGGVGGVIDVWFGDGTGRLEIDPARAAPAVNGTVHAFAIGDVDGDGDLDVAVAVSGQSALLINDGTGRLVDDTLTRLPQEAGDTQALVLADLDGDGDLDLMLANAGPSPLFAQQNALWFNDGSGSFTDVTAARLPTRSDFSYALVVGDVDVDGDLDVIVGNWNIPLPPNPAQPNVLLHNDGTGRFTEATAGELPPDLAATAGLALGDLDGDGDLDLATVHAQGAPDFVYWNDGTGRFTFALYLPGTASSSSYAIALGDLDGDGDLDVVVGRRDQHNVVIRNDGAGVFTDVSATIQPNVVDATVAVALADVDGDQDLDVFFGNRSFQKDRLLVNRLRQISAPYVARIGQDWPIDVSVTSTPGPAVAGLWLSTSRLTSPIRLAPFGDYFLGDAQPLNAGFRAVNPATGVARYPFVIPASAALIGQDVYLQAAALASSNLLDLRFTGFWHDVVGD